MEQRVQLIVVFAEVGGPPASGGAVICRMKSARASAETRGITNRKTVLETLCGGVTVWFRPLVQKVRAMLSPAKVGPPPAQMSTYMMGADGSSMCGKPIGPTYAWWSESSAMNNPFNPPGNSTGLNACGKNQPI